jgi:hypothetical protein
VTIYKRGGVYWYEFMFAGRRIRESSGATNQQTARSAESKRRLDLVEGGLRPKRQTGPRAI